MQDPVSSAVYIQVHSGNLSFIPEGQDLCCSSLSYAADGKAAGCYCDLRPGGGSLRRAAVCFGRFSLNGEFCFTRLIHIFIYPDIRQTGRNTVFDGKIILRILGFQLFKCIGKQTEVSQSECFCSFLAHNAPCINQIIIMVFLNHTSF